MLKLLARLFLKEKADLPETELRRRYGVLCGAYGVFLNLLLGAAKLFVGMRSGSISISADAVNNLSDASSSIVTLLGFWVAGKKPDADHPFGHGRSEYVAGLIVSMAIVVMGIELLLSSVEKIFNPKPTEFSLLALLVLLASILVKLYMMLYNRSAAKRFSSAALQATAADSLSDCIATSVVLLCMLLAHFANLNLDAYAGTLVAGFILYTGIHTARDIISRILGNPPDPDLVSKIEKLVLQSEIIVGLHDMIVHDYGPGNIIVSLHAEVPVDGDLLMIHEEIDRVELQIRRELGCTAILHIDPIATKDENVLRIKRLVAEKMTALSPEVTIHDFRISPGPEQSNLIFDVVVPFSLDLTDDQVQEYAEGLAKELNPCFHTIVEVDRPF